MQLQQVVLNLVLNAADAMTGIGIEERRLTVRTEEDDAEVRLYVIDNGTGIAADDLPKVFDAFWSTKAGGMGIGLAICQSIVAAHHGRITATNNPDGGATFCVSLPVKHPTDREVHDATIFIVDDDPAVLKAQSRVLREEGWAVETFESAEAFLARSGTRKAAWCSTSRCRPRRTRASAPTRRARPVGADRIRERLRRHPDVGARDEGGCRGLPDQARPLAASDCGGSRRDRAGLRIT